MKLKLVSIGPGGREQMSVAAVNAVLGADCLIGAPRLLDTFSDSGAPAVPLITAKEIAAFTESHPTYRSICVLLSGDAGFYSGAKKLAEQLGPRQVEILPGISSVSCFAARLQTPWQDWHLVSAHGVECDIVSHVANYEKTFVLTGGKITPAILCGQLLQAGLGEVLAFAGENLSYETERVVSGTAEELAQMEFAPLSVLLLVNQSVRHREEPVTFGLPDTEFVRGEVPMTKSEVRSVILSKLRVCPHDIVWDVGAGTGSVSVELALAARFGKVYAVECSQEGCGLISQNAARFSLHNLYLTRGMAPQACGELPAPDAAFIGGSKGNLEEILQLLKEKNPRVRVCISAITIETVSQALEALGKLGFERIEAVQVSIAKTKRAGRSNLLMANNPVFVISAFGRDDG